MLAEALGGDHSRTQLTDPVAQVGIADGRGGACARCPCELDRGRPDAARAAVHEEVLARLQPRLREDRVVRGCEHLRHAARLGPRQAVRYGHQDALVDNRQLGLGAAADNRHHAVTFVEAHRARSERGNLARQLQPWDVLRRTRRGWVVTPPLVHVGPVEARGVHPHQHLTRPRHWIRMLFHDELLVFDRDAAHQRGTLAEVVVERSIMEEGCKYSALLPSMRPAG